MENFDLKYVVFIEDLIHCDLFKINNQKNHQTNTSVKIMKFSNQMISKSYNSHMNTNHTITGFQRDQNC